MLGQCRAVRLFGCQVWRRPCHRVGGFPSRCRHTRQRLSGLPRDGGISVVGHGDSDIVKLLPATVPGARIALAGLHSWTDVDFPNIAKWGLSTLSPNDLRDSTQPLLEWLNATGCSRVAIHLDVDVVDSNEAVIGLGAEPDGLTSSQVHRVITDMQGAAEVVGLTIAEYVPRQAMAVQRLLNGLPLI
jgi:arginase